MSSLLEKALEKVVALPPTSRMRLRRKFLRRLPTRKPGRSALPRNATSSGAWRVKPLKQTRGVKRSRSTICFDSFPDYPDILALILPSAV